MPWWGWMIVGAILLGAELMVIDAQFYLVFLGLAAMAVGLADLTGLGGPQWVQWLAFGLLSLSIMVLFRGRLYRRLRGDLPGYSNDAAGQILGVPEGLAAHGETRIEFRGTTWRVLNSGEEAIPAGGRAIIEPTEGLTLHVRATD